MSIKVLHLFNEYLGTSENWAYNLIKNTPGVEVHIGARNYIDNTFLDPDFKFIPNYYDKPLRRYRKLKNLNPFHIIEKFWIRLMPLLRGSVKAIFTEYVKREKIDLIHCHFANVGYHFLNIAEKTGKPFVVSFYGWDYEKLPFINPDYVSNYKLLFDKADLFLCEGPHGKQTLISMGCPESKIEIQKLGLHPAGIAKGPQPKKENELLLVQLASYVEKKGQIYALEAYKIALKTCPNMKLTFAGFQQDKKIVKRLQDYISNHGLESSVSLLEGIEYGDMSEFLNCFNLFIHPSCYAMDMDCEGGAPVAILNAQAVGLPVIATKHCDIPSYVEEGKSALLCEEKDIECIANKIAQFYTMNQGDYDTYSSSAIHFVNKNYNLKENGTVLKAYYDKLIKRG